MTHTIEVEIDAAGNIHPLDLATPLPKGRALLVVQTGPTETMLLSEAALAVDWLKPEEDEAWAELVPVPAMKMPEQEMNWEEFFRIPAGTVPHEVAVQAAIDGRGDR